MKSDYKAHLERLAQAIYFRYDLTEVPNWITTKTRIRGQLYSFTGHEFQERIISDVSQVVNTQKCSQIGMSEVMARWMLGTLAAVPYFSIINTFPFAGDAEGFCRTRINPIIKESPELMRLLDQNLDNMEVKKIGNSMIYFRGTNSSTAAISIPADCIVSDEIDRSLPDVLTQYESRLTHSKWQLRRNFSTPTIPSRGIAKEMKTSRRFRNMCKCSHCAKTFLPDYFNHVKLENWDKPLRELRKEDLPRLPWQDAKLLCPFCGKVPDLGPQYREWVLENTLDNHTAAGYYVSPFDAPSIITVAQLIEKSTKYRNYTEFVNQNLGLAEENEQENLTEALIRRAFVQEEFSGGVHVMGCDMGQTCHIVIMMFKAGRRFVVHREQVHFTDFEVRQRELLRKYRVLMTVCDSQPYTDMIMRMQRTNQNLFGAIFVTTKGLQLYALQDQDRDPETGRQMLRQAKVNRNTALEDIMSLFRQEQNGILIRMQSEAEDTMFVNHLLDLKKEQKIDGHGEQQYVWTKSEDGADHFTFALLYAYIASCISTLTEGTQSTTRVSLVGKFKNKELTRPV